MSGIKAVVVPRDLYYHEIAYVRGLETEVEALKARAEAAEKRIDDLLEQAEKTRLVMVRRWEDTLQWKARAEAAEKEQREAAASSCDAWKQRNAIYEELVKVQARAEAAEKEAKRWKDVAKNLASSAETDRDAALFDKAVAGGKVKLAEARAEAAEKRVKELESEFNAMTVEMRAANIARVVEATGTDFVGLANRCEAAEDKLLTIRQWCEAYPLDIFPEPDHKKARALLEAGGMTIDAISASNMRHVLNGIRRLIEAKS